MRPCWDWLDSCEERPTPSGSSRVRLCLRARLHLLRIPRIPRYRECPYTAVWITSGCSMCAGDLRVCTCVLCIVYCCLQAAGAGAPVKVVFDALVACKGVQAPQPRPDSTTVTTAHGQMMPKPPSLPPVPLTPQPSFGTLPLVTEPAEGQSGNRRCRRRLSALLTLLSKLLLKLFRHLSTSTQRNPRPSCHLVRKGDRLTFHASMQ
jgi:hypothetical protein